MISLDPDVLGNIVRQALRDELAGFSNLAQQRIAYRESDAAEALGVPLWTLQEARRLGEIEGRRKGRAYYYTREELLAWLNRS